MTTDKPLPLHPAIAYCTICRCCRNEYSPVYRCWDAVLWLDRWKKALLYLAFSILLFIHPHRLWLSSAAGMKVSLRFKLLGVVSKGSSRAIQVQIRACQISCARGGGQKSDGSSVLHPDSMYPILDSKHTSTHEHKSDNITRRVDLLIMSGVVNCINCARFET